MKHSLLAAKILSGSILLCTVVSVLAQNDNPTGKAGVFNGYSTTGGIAFEPYTANATRTIVDLTVSSAIGSYPLQWSRTMNSRQTEGPSYAFGQGGSWQHSYGWDIDWETEQKRLFNSTPRPKSYIVYYPDGRRVDFQRRASLPTDSLWRGPAGVTDRFQPVVGTGSCYLFLSDGGKVEFHQDGILDDQLGWQFYLYPVAIIDPYGQRTSLFYGGPSGQLSQITEPAGRWLRINYASGTSLISSVEAGYGVNTVTQSVTYTYQQFTVTHPQYPSLTYTYTTLTGVSYSDGTSAAYTYQAANTYPNTGPPLIQTCDDVRFPGPMKKIAYEFAPAGDESSGGIYGEFMGARKWLFPAPYVLTYWLGGHMETRGDGGSRTFSYGSLPLPFALFDANDPSCVPQPYLLSAYTDFKGVVNGVANWTRFCYDVNTYLNSVTDANGNTTTFTKTPLTGKILTVTHPPDANGVVSTRQYFYTNQDTAYYLDHVTDELGHTTVYQRDDKRRIKIINYPDNASEEFTYNNFGQLQLHRLTNGGWESVSYDSRGRILEYRDSDHISSVPTARYGYDTLDRVSGVTDARGFASGDSNYTTNYEYNQRGQVTKVMHPTDPVTGARYTVENGYNADGTLNSVKDERGNITTYGYDDYKRLSTITAPIAFAGDTTPRVTFLYYDRTGGTTVDYTHADSNVGNVTSPLGNTVKTLYDNNFWKSSVTAGTGAEAATTSYTYDLIGNLRTVKDPKGQSTGAFTEYFYDKRNRLMHVDDPIALDRNSLGHTVSWTYDQIGNKKSQQRANNQMITYDQYDPMNRLQIQSVQHDVTVSDRTVMTYDLAGNFKTFTDARQKQYTYEYDFLNRKTKTIYPADGGGTIHEEQYHYDLANNMDTFTDRAGAVQTFEYDSRNRQTHFWWNTWPLYTMHERWLTYDPVSNITRVRTEGEDINDLVYDWRNRKTSDTQTPNGRPARTIGHTYDADSNRKTLTYPSGYQLTYNYNSRNQLREELDASGTVVSYTYDLSGNRTSRSLRNGTYTQYYLDALNRPFAIGNWRGGVRLGALDYGYDSVSRISWVKRDPDQPGFYDYDRDDYDYYLDDQLKAAQFNASGSDFYSAPPRNTTSLVYDANGNRVSQTNTATPSYTYTVNDLNQYNSVNASVPAYDATGNLSQYDGWTYGYNRQNQVAVVRNGANTLNFYYDGFNRQILRYVNGQWIYSAWDGWNLLEEYDINGQVIHSYVHGAATDELISRSDTQPGSNRVWYYQDTQGSTTHLANDSGNIVEKYKYDPALAGAPSVYNASGSLIDNSAYDNRFLYTGREYYKEGAIYDYRNRFYLPSLGRFLQPDPIGFAGDPSNLYRYCGNNQVNLSDPTGEVGVRAVITGGIVVIILYKIWYATTHREPAVPPPQPRPIPEIRAFDPSSVRPEPSKMGPEPPDELFLQPRTMGWMDGSGATGPAWYQPGYQPSAGIAAAIARGDYSNAYGQSASSAANAALMASQAYGGNPNNTGNTGDEGHTIFNTGQDSHWKGRVVDGVLTHIPSTYDAAGAAQWRAIAGGQNSGAPITNTTDPASFDRLNAWLMARAAIMPHPPTGR